MIIYGKNNVPIYSVDDWLKHAPPAEGIKHWVESRSAFELANAWFHSGKAEIPAELNKLLHSHKDTENIKLKIGYLEKETRLDKFGKGRNHDLLLTGTSNSELGKSIVAIEAKADESYGDLIGNQLEKASPNSNLPKRIEQLALAIFGHQEINELRYQLLHATAGTLIEAKNFNANKAIFVVHQFHSTTLSKNKINKNNNDLNKFVSSLLGQPVLVESGKLIGPISVPGGEFVPSEIPLYIGQVDTQNVQYEN